MRLKTLRDIDITNKTVLYRSPYDIGVTEENGILSIKDDSRIKATLPTLKYLLDKNCKIVIVTWVKRPEGIDEKLRTIPHAIKLSELLNHPVKHVNDCIGQEMQQAIVDMQPKDVLMLENTRFHQEEFDENDDFAKALTFGSDLIVFDGFPQAHRKSASTTGILKHLPAVCGFYFEQEYNSLSGLLNNPENPFTVVIGGTKLSEKVDAIENLMESADIVLLGGGVANVFLKAEGKELGNSFVEEQIVGEKADAGRDMVQVAKTLLLANESVSIFKTTTDLPVQELFIPHDLIAGKSVDNDSEYLLQMAFEQNKPIPDGYGAYDIGPLTAKVFSEIILQSKTVFWAGPMGVYEKQNYSNGTATIAKAISMTKAKTIVAGGDTIDALVKFGDPSKVDHISLAGGATLDYLGGKNLVVMDYLASN